jgi:hypothetical protein
MERSSPDTLWRRFVRDIADPPQEAAPTPEADFDEVMRTVRELSVRLPPHTLRVIDQDTYARGLRSISESDLNAFIQDLAEQSDGAISHEEARALAADKFAVLCPVELLSFPYPEIRAVLVGRFGANSVVGGLRDLYDFESNKRVRGVIIEAMHGRLHWRDLKESERQEIFEFAEAVLRGGYDKGTDIFAARAAYYLLADLATSRLPRGLRMPVTQLYNPRIDHLNEVDQVGFVRIIGPRIGASPLLDLVAKERKISVLEELLSICDERWGRGIISPDDSVAIETPSEFWQRLATVLVGRLGLADIPSDSLKVVLEQKPGEDEPRWRALLRKLALVALDESSGGSWS